MTTPIIALCGLSLAFAAAGAAAVLLDVDRRWLRACLMVAIGALVLATSLLLGELA